MNETKNKKGYSVIINNIKVLECVKKSIFDEVQ